MIPCTKTYAIFIKIVFNVLQFLLENKNTILTIKYNEYILNLN